MNVREIGAMIEGLMEANGGDRREAVETIIAEFKKRPSTFFNGPAFELMCYCHRQYRRNNNTQPDQLSGDSSNNSHPMDRSYPTGPSGEWKAARELTREDIEAQVEVWRSTVRGLKPRITAGEKLIDIMEEGDLLVDAISRVENGHELAATYLGVEEEALKAA